MTNPPLSVLVVDDDFDICEAYGEALAECGYDVTTAHNGREALQYLERSDAVPVVIVVDLMMPIMDGRELVAELRRSRRFEHTPIVMMTANRGPALVEGTTHLYKPFSLEVLCEVVHELIQRAAAPPRSLTMTP
jgi:CheY-like chemotaxis protein